MERLEQLEILFRKLDENRKTILMDTQNKFCGPCGGFKATHIYRSPVSAEIGAMLDRLKQ